MRKFTFGIIVLSTLAGAASADVEFSGGNLNLVSSFTLGEPSGFTGRATAGASYSNIDNFTGNAYVAGGAALQGTNTITKMFYDDIACALPYLDGQSFTQFSFNVANLNTVAVSARARVRFYADAAGLPGNYITGFSFNPISFTANSVGTYTATIAAGFLQPVGGLFWAGITFDNNSGGTGATAAQLNNLGMGVFNPPAVGSSTANFGVTAAAGSFLVNNPGGTIFNGFQDGTPGNFGWEFVVPAPGAATLLGLAGVVAGRRRRR